MGHQKDRRRIGVRTALAAAVSLMVLAAIVAAMSVSDAPGELRQQKIDQQRLEDLRSLSGMIDENYLRSGELPESLDDVEIYWQPRRDVTLDPETGEPYEYRKVDERNFELCATFMNDSDVYKDRGMYYAEPTPIRMPGETMPKMRSWQHPAGHHCFEMEAPVMPEKPDPVPEPAE